MNFKKITIKFRRLTWFPGGAINGGGDFARSPAVRDPKMAPKIERPGDGGCERDRERCGLRETWNERSPVAGHAPRGGRRLGMSVREEERDAGSQGFEGQRKRVKVRV